MLKNSFLTFLDLYVQFWLEVKFDSFKILLYNNIR